MRCRPDHSNRRTWLRHRQARRHRAAHAIRRQHHLPYICAMPTNLYGPGDNFNPHDSHVLPAMIRRFHQAARDGARPSRAGEPARPRREFMYVDDLADACHFLLDHYDDERPINVGTGADVTIAELADARRRDRRLPRRDRWDTVETGRHAPEAARRRTLRRSRMDSENLAPEGIRTTYEWFLAHQSDYRR